MSRRPAALWHRLPPQFEDQLTALVGHVSAFHFDDGYDDVLRAADALEARGLRGVFFVVSGWLGIPGQATAAQVRQLARRGHEIANHTDHHVLADKVPPDVLYAEITRCQAVLTDLAGTVPTRLAWPYGKSDDGALAVARTAGAWAQVRGITPAEIYAPRSRSAVDVRATRP